MSRVTAPLPCEGFCPVTVTMCYTCHAHQLSRLDSTAVSYPVSPTVAAWELALRLRRRRVQLGVEVRTITQRLGFSRNYWSAVENERKILSEENLVKLL